MAPRKWERTPLVGRNEGPKGRWFTKPLPEGWTEPVIVEWELTAEVWTDRHEHDEYAYVIEGQLFVESDGVTVELNTGDMVCVPAGAIGRYWAPKYARMLGIYSPNPKGSPTTHMSFTRLDQDKA